MGETAEKCHVYQRMSEETVIETWICADFWGQELYICQKGTVIEFIHIIAV